MTALLRAHWPLAASFVLGVLLGWQLFHSQQPAVHEKASEHAEQAVAKKVEKDTDKETTRDTGPTRKIVRDFNPQCPPPGGAPAVLRETIIESGPTQVITRTATEVRAEEQARTVEDRKLDLTITPPQLPRWAVQVGVDDALGARGLRIAGRFRVVGPIWLELSAVPLQRSVGVAGAVEW